MTTTDTSTTTERATAFIRDLFADADNNRDRMGLLIGAIGYVASQSDLTRSDAERLAEIRGFLAEYRRMQKESGR